MTGNPVYEYFIKILLKIFDYQHESLNFAADFNKK
jgi:hypothetical protein